MRDDARQAEIGPEQAGADHAVMRHDDQPVDLLVAVVGEREHRPVGVAFARAHLDAAHDAVGAGRGRHLDAVGFGFLRRSVAAVRSIAGASMRTLTASTARAAGSRQSEGGERSR